MKKLLASLIVLLCVTSAFAQNFDFPSSPTVDQIVTGPAGQQMKWDGTKWVAMLGGGAAGQATVTVSPTAPASPTNGALWFDTTDAQMYVWYSNGSTTQWAPVAHR